VEKGRGAYKIYQEMTNLLNIIKDGKLLQTNQKRGGGQI
jgi:hypothetical protein